MSTFAKTWPAGSGHAHPSDVVERLEGIDEDLGSRQNEYEQAADDRARLLRDWEKRLAYSMKKASGSNSEARKASALVTAIEVDDLYERLTDAEARYDALKVVTRVLETRTTIAQSILKAQGRA